MTVANYNEAINFINQREKPLALYVFSNDNNVNEEFKERTSSGSLGFNEVLMQISCNLNIFKFYLILKMERYKRLMLHVCGGILYWTFRVNKITR
jgi:hypothetical protein